jgi:hypothetical protein
MPNEDVSYSKVMAGMLQSADIASTILNVVSAKDDIDHTETELQGCKNIISGWNLTLQKFNNKFNLSGDNLVMESYNDLQQWLPTILDYTRQSSYWSRLGWGCAARMMAEKAKLLSQQQILDTNAAIVFDIRESILRHKAEEYWLGVYRPAEPSESLVIQQYIRGNCNPQTAADALARKGVPDNMAMWLYDSYENYPSIRELVLASQYVPITDATLLANMKYSNITLQQNKDFYLQYAHSIQLRNELNRMLSQLQATYTDGLISKVDLTAEIVAHKPNANEQEQILSNCDQAYATQLLRMEVNAETYLYRTQVYDEIAALPENNTTGEIYFYDTLVSQGMDTAMANALVRLEAAKRGINWERA